MYSNKELCFQTNRFKLHPKDLLKELLNNSDKRIRESKKKFFIMNRIWGFDWFEQGKTFNQITQ